uniref:Uncharacterized protein n=1 Tax=Cyanistes caeruleus TaxID=156563 RepID=A0A8C0U600_CYACU
MVVFRERMALEKNPDDAECYCQRAYAHILLQKYADAVADAKKSLEINPNNAVAFLRKGLGEYHIKNYASALESFREGQRLDNVDDTFTIWIKRCEETLNGKEKHIYLVRDLICPVLGSCVMFFKDSQLSSYLEQNNLFFLFQKLCFSVSCFS